MYLACNRTQKVISIIVDSVAPRRQSSARSPAYPRRATKIGYAPATFGSLFVRYFASLLAARSIAKYVRAAPEPISISMCACVCNLVSGKGVKVAATCLQHIF